MTELFSRSYVCFWLNNEMGDNIRTQKYESLIEDIGKSVESEKKILEREDVQSIFMVACVHGDSRIAEYFLENRIMTVNQKLGQKVPWYRSEYCAAERGETTPLFSACVCGSVSIVKLLIEKGADLYYNDNETCLMAACASGNADLVKLLLENNCDPDIKECKTGSTCLSIVICEPKEPFEKPKNADKVELVKLLIQHGANVNLQDCDGNTPLHHAVVSKSLDLVKILVDSGCQWDIENSNRQTVLLSAVAGYDISHVEYVIKKCQVPVLQQIEAFELLGASLILDAHDSGLGTQMLVKTLDMRQMHNYPKDCHHIIGGEAMKEFNTTEELQNLQFLPFEQSLLLQIQACFSYERLRGAEDYVTSQNFIKLAQKITLLIGQNFDQGVAQECFKFFVHAFNLRHCAKTLLIDEEAEIVGVPAFVALLHICEFLDVFKAVQSQNANISCRSINFQNLLSIFEKIVDVFERETGKSVKNGVKHLEDGWGYTSTDLVMCLLHHIVGLLPSASEAESRILSRSLKRLLKCDPRSSSYDMPLLNVAVGSSSFQVYCDSDCCNYYPVVGKTPLKENIKMDVIELLLENGADANNVDYRHFTSLHEAVSLKENKDIVEMLLKYGGHFDATNWFGETFWKMYETERRPRRVHPAYCMRVRHSSLQCLASQLLYLHNIGFKLIIPKSLVPFVEMHTPHARDKL